MYVAPNNRLSNHFRKKRVEKQVWVDDQTVSSSFYQNIRTMREKTNIQMLYENYLNPDISFSNNHQPNIFYNNSYPHSLQNACKCFGTNLFNHDDGLSDWEEAARYGTNWRDEDCDDDSLLDGEEINTYGTDPNNPDTDNDRILDGYNVTLDISDSHEYYLWLSDDWQNKYYHDGYTFLGELSYGTNANDYDTDGDDMRDGWEIWYGLDPLDDGIYKWERKGTEGSYYWETTVLSPDDLNGSCGDPDGDMLTNIEEYHAKLHPTNPDTDGDGLTDFQETLVKFRTNAVDGNYDADGVWIAVDANEDGLLEGYSRVMGSYVSEISGSVVTMSPEYYYVYKYGNDVIMNVQGNCLVFSPPSSNAVLSPYINSSFAENGQETHDTSFALNPDVDGDGVIDSMDLEPTKYWELDWTLTNLTIPEYTLHIEQAVDITSNTHKKKPNVDVGDTIEAEGCTWEVEKIVFKGATMTDWYNWIPFSEAFGGEGHYMNHWLITLTNVDPYVMGKYNTTVFDDWEVRTGAKNILRVQISISEEYDLAGTMSNETGNYSTFLYSRYIVDGGTEIVKSNDEFVSSLGEHCYQFEVTLSPDLSTKNSFLVNIDPYWVTFKDNRSIYKIEDVNRDAIKFAGIETQSVWDITKVWVNPSMDVSLFEIPSLSGISGVHYFDVDWVDVNGITQHGYTGYVVHDVTNETLSVIQEIARNGYYAGSSVDVVFVTGDDPSSVDRVDSDNDTLWNVSIWCRAEVRDEALAQGMEYLSKGADSILQLATQYAAYRENSIGRTVVFAHMNYHYAFLSETQTTTSIHLCFEHLSFLGKTPTTPSNAVYTYSTTTYCTEYSSTPNSARAGYQVYVTSEVGTKLTFQSKVEKLGVSVSKWLNAATLFIIAAGTAYAVYEDVTNGNYYKAGFDIAVGSCFFASAAMNVKVASALTRGIVVTQLGARVLSGVFMGIAFGLLSVYSFYIGDYNNGVAYAIDTTIIVIALLLAPYTAGISVVVVILAEEIAFSLTYVLYYVGILDHTYSIGQLIYNWDEFWTDFNEGSIFNWALPWG